jgi:simple sugar transport system ATP-binding protein
MQIELREISKSFGRVRANDRISLTFAPGQIIGILGENGAGKSTLMKILSGYQPADSGEIVVNGEPVDYHGPQAAIGQGIGMLQQDPLDVNAFTVLENFVFGRQQRGTKSGFIQRIFFNQERAERELRDICTRFGFELDPDRLIRELSIAQRQQLEIVRLLAQGVETLILDEPTTGISAEQEAILFDTLRNLADEGMTILLVSHKLEDVIRLCDEVAVLRSGKIVGTRDMPATKAELVEMMFGEALTVQQRLQRDFSQADVALQMQQIELREGRIHIQGFDLSVREGEVIGFAGLDGNGQEALMRAAAGLIPIESGDIRVQGKSFAGKAHRAYRDAGVIFGAAGRLEEGLIAGLTLTDHIALVETTTPVINWQRIRQRTDQHIQHYDVRGKASDRIESLSGGNQQRLLMALIPDDPVAMILEQPTRGLDVDSAAWIWQQLLARCEKHNAALLFSSVDLDELLTYSDRIVVCFAGRTYLVDDPTAIDSRILGHLIGGEFDRDEDKDEGDNS